MDEAEIDGLWHGTLSAGATDPGATLRPPLGTLDGAATVAPPSAAMRPSGPEADETPGTLVLRGATPVYTLLGELGRGGMGVVHRARQAGLEREVAVKRIAAPSPELTERFVAEARVTGALDHPNIVPVHELGRSADGEAFLAMKLVGGRSWRELIHAPPAGEAWDLDRHLGVLQSVCNAVAFAHARGIIHRDLKPENVMVGGFGEVLVMDWGIAVGIGEEGSAGHAPHRSTVRAPAGTPSYMAPEMAEGRGADLGPWTDVFLLGAILHELLCGRPPHQGASVHAVLVAASRCPPPQLPASAPAGLASICRRALSRDHRQRHADAAAFRDDLAAYLSHRESERVAASARAQLTACVDAQDGGEAARNARYAAFAEAVAGFAQALVLWPGNDVARAGEREARLAFARAAFAGGDLGLAEAQLARVDGDDAAALAGEVASARAARERARRQARTLRVALGAAAALIVAGLATGYLLVSAEQQRTATALGEAQRERDAKEHARQEAESNRERADAAATKATAEAVRADEQAKLATEALGKARSEAARADAQAKLALEAADQARVEARRADQEAKAAIHQAWRGRIRLAQAMYERGLAESEQGRSSFAAAYHLGAIEIAPPNQVPEGYQPAADDDHVTWAEFAWRAFRMTPQTMPGQGGKGDDGGQFDVAFAGDRLLRASGRGVVISRGSDWDGESIAGNAGAVAASADGSVHAVAMVGQPVRVWRRGTEAPQEVPVPGQVVMRLALDAAGERLAMATVPHHEEARWNLGEEEWPYTISVQRLSGGSRQTCAAKGRDLPCFALLDTGLAAQTGERLLRLRPGADAAESEALAENELVQAAPGGPLLRFRPAAGGVELAIGEGPAVRRLIIHGAATPVAAGVGGGRALLVTTERGHIVDLARAEVIGDIRLNRPQDVRRVALDASGLQAVVMVPARSILSGFFRYSLAAGDGLRPERLLGIGSAADCSWYDGDGPPPVTEAVGTALPSADGRSLLLAHEDGRLWHVADTATNRLLRRIPIDAPTRLLPWIDRVGDRCLVRTSTLAGELKPFVEESQIFADEAVPGRIKPGTMVNQRRGGGALECTFDLLWAAGRKAGFVDLPHDPGRGVSLQQGSNPQLLNADGGSMVVLHAQTLLVYQFDSQSWARIVDPGVANLDLASCYTVASHNRGYVAVIDPGLRQLHLFRQGPTGFIRLQQAPLAWGGVQPAAPAWPRAPLPGEPGWRPGQPAMPAMPAQPWIPGMPGQPQNPGMPGLIPGTPVLPGMPGSPGMPGQPQIPGMPGQIMPGQIPGMPMPGQAQARMQPGQAGWLQTLPMASGVLELTMSVPLPGGVVNWHRPGDIAMLFASDLVVASTGQLNRYTLGVPTALRWVRAITATALAVSEDGAYLAAWDGSLPGAHLVDSWSGRVIRTLRSPGRPVPYAPCRIAFTPGSTHLIASYSGGCVRWKLAIDGAGKPPTVDPTAADPIAAFRPFYERVRFRVATSGPRAGEAEFYKP